MPHRFTSSPRRSNSNWAALERLAADNGGLCFDLTRRGDAEVLAAIRQPAYRPLSAKATAGNVSELLSNENAGKRHFSIVGRLESPQATVALQYHADRAPDVDRTFAIDAATATSGSLLRRIWAQRRLDRLLDDELGNQQEIAELGKQYGIVTPCTSLMVLETLDQYLMYGIEPPDSSPEMEQEYLRLNPPGARNHATQAAAAERAERRAKIDEVAHLWQQRVKWWSTDARHPSAAAAADRNRHPQRPAAPSGFGMGFGQPLSGLGKSSATQSQGGSTMGGGMSGGMAGMSAGGMGMGGGGMGGGIGLGGGGLGGMGGGLGGMGGGFFGGGMPAQPPAGAGPPQPDNPAAPANAGQFSIKAFRHYHAAQVALQPRDPKATYLQELHAAAAHRAFAAYMQLRRRFERSPDFYLECADFFFEQHETDKAIQVLSNLAELNGSDMKLARLMGHRLARAGAYDLAVETFEDILKRQPNEPQSYRDLALVLDQRAEEARTALNPNRSSHVQSAERGDPLAATRGKAEIAADYARAMKLLAEIVGRRWDGRFAEIELPVLMELNRIAVRATTFGVKRPEIDARLCRLLDLDLRIVVTWSDPEAGVQLVVREPDGDKADAGRGATRIGGLASNSSAVLGPEEYLVRRAINGEYLIQAAFAKPAAPARSVQVDVEIFTNFGRNREQRRTFTARLDATTDTVTLGRVKL